MTNDEENEEGPVLTIKSAADAERYLNLLKASAARAQTWLLSQSAEPLALLSRMKFDAVGVHPVEGRPLNIVEQINQTWTYAVAIAAAKQLMLLHPEAGGYLLAPGAHAKTPLDVMSIVPGLVGAETFAAVKPSNNRKLAKDLAKLQSRPERFRYIFFMSPSYPSTSRVPKLEKFGIEVWSVTL